MGLRQGIRQKKKRTRAVGVTPPKGGQFRITAGGGVSKGKKENSGGKTAGGNDAKGGGEPKLCRKTEKNRKSLTRGAAADVPLTTTPFLDNEKTHRTVENQKQPRPWGQGGRVRNYQEISGRAYSLGKKIGPAIPIEKTARKLATGPGRWVQKKKKKTNYNGASKGTWGGRLCRGESLTKQRNVGGWVARNKFQKSRWASTKRGARTRKTFPMKAPGGRCKREYMSGPSKPTQVRFSTKKILRKRS